jgi:hypothetical protein
MAAPVATAARVRMPVSFWRALAIIPLLWKEARQ